ncbi:MAG: glycosyltransferase family 4 protein [Bacteroides sp.]|nr:glycosyltransferase family 4 protein [Bacteroides sp.]
MRRKLIKTSTVPISLNHLLTGQLKYLNQHFDVIGVSSNGEDLKEVEKREKIKIIKIEMSRHIALFKDCKSLLDLYYFLKKEKPFIIHSITPKAGLLSMIAGKLAGIPIRMHTFTGLIFPSRTGFMQKLLIGTDRLLCACATHVYPEGEGVKKDLMNYNITKKPLKILANGNVNGIDVNFFDPTLYNDIEKNLIRSGLHINSEDFVFVFIGRLVSDKGINELIEAFNKMAEFHTKIKLLLIGPMETALDPLLPSTIKTIEIHKQIISIGWQSDVRPYFAISDALVFPSYREGFPNVVMQAGAMGLPAIVTDINGCNEIIKEGENGIIIPSKSSKELKEKMELLLTDKELYSNLKLKAREMITSRYEQKLVWEALLAEYHLLEKEYVQKRS